MDGRLKPHSMDRERALITAPWCRQDLFFLQDTLRRGASFSEVAGFLCRHEGEVREKAKELGIDSVEEPCASRTKRPAARGRERGKQNPSEHRPSNPRASRFRRTVEK
jgi:hypothetical protein